MIVPLILNKLSAMKDMKNMKDKRTTSKGVNRWK